MVNLKIALLTFAIGVVFFTMGCDKPPEAKKTSAPHVVSGVITPPAVQNDSPKEPEKDEVTALKKNMPKTTAEAAKGEVKTDPKSTEQKLFKGNHYISKGKIDPFSPLIQDTPEEKKPVVDNRPKRILTPLEKIELSQIRLVAVIIMQDRRIAMVEDASGKGYEVVIGTYIGKNAGKVSEIKKSSIVVKELVKDFKGKLTENFKEIKLHKNDNGE